MHCASCGSEYLPGIERCSECGGELLPGDLPDRPDLRLKEPPPDPVTVFTSRNPALFPVARSILEGEEVPYFVRGEELQDLFGIGRLGLGFNPIVGPIEIQVPAADAERARELLADVELETTPAEPPDGDGEAVERRVRATPSPRREGTAHAAVPLAGPRAQGAFRLLVAADLTIMLARWLLPSPWMDEFPQALLDQLDAYFGYGAFAERIDYFGFLLAVLSLVVSIGLLSLSPWARSLYALLWCWWLVASGLGRAMIDYGFHSSLRLLGHLLGGAILALAFYGPIAEVFAAKKAARAARRPRPSPTSPG